MTFRRAFVFTFFSTLVIAAAFMAGYMTYARLNPWPAYPVFGEARDILQRQGLKALPEPPALEYGMIRGMVQAYDDPYTVFVEPVQAELQSNALQGSFGGIGVRLGNDPAGYWVVFPFPASPAEAAGVKEGDRLLGIDELQVGIETTLDNIQSAIRGPVGKSVKITIGHAPDFVPVQVMIERAEIPLPSVTWHLDPSEPRIGVLEINLIAASTSEEIQKAVADLQARGATHFVLDLRNNPGGLLTAGVDIARLFLKEGPILEQQYRDKEVESYKVERPGPLADLPLAVLINHNSASAAEIVAGALKVNGRAPLVGSPSFGKDSIQLVFTLQDSSSLHVTAAHWWVPGLQPPINQGGLQPDFPAPDPIPGGGPDPSLQAAIQVLLGASE